MITGFNTDIIYEGITYHVQTEDKGLDTPMILSLIYDGGTILASKRSPYNDLLENFDEKLLNERLQRQHKLICAAVKAGRIEDLKRMTMKASNSNKIEDDAPIPAPIEVEIVEAVDQNSEKTGFETFIIPKKMLDDLPEIELETSTSEDLTTKIEKSVPEKPQILNTIPPNENIDIPIETATLLAFRERTIFIDRSEEIFANVSDPFARDSGKIPKPEDGLIFEVPKIISEPVSEPIIEEVKIIEEEMILPEEAVMIVSENINQPQIVEDKLTISLLNDLEFKSGERKTLNISVHRGSEEFGLVKAHVIIKILGSTFRPIIFHAKTDSNGVAVVHLQLPNFNSGRAVLLVRVLHDGEEAEMRRVIAQG